MKSGVAALLERIPETATTEVWLVDCVRSADTLDAEEAKSQRLSDDEIGRGRRIPGDLDRRIWRASHIALRLLVERWAGPTLRRVPFDFTPGGRPELPRPAPAFSLSHSGSLALIGLVRRGTIGVDLQEVAPRLVKEERRQRMEDYALRIARGAPLPEGRDLRFIQAWTRIEALAKADGRGIGKTLTEAGLLGAPAAGAHTASYLVRDVGVRPGFAASLASTTRPLKIEETRDFCALLLGEAAEGTRS